MRHVVLVLLLATLFSYNTALAVEEGVVPSQTIENGKGFAGLNYDRQDSEQVGTQRIVNDHSAFNINIQIIKKGALFQRVQQPSGSLGENGGEVEHEDN